VPIGLIFGVAFPILLLIIFGNIAAFSQATKALGGLTRFSVYFPIDRHGLGQALLSLPTHLASYREQGILRRMSTTPVSPACAWRSSCCQPRCSQRSSP
jgi:ABC-2 type transport system permease protein